MAGGSSIEYSGFFGVNHRTTGSRVWSFHQGFPCRSVERFGGHRQYAAIHVGMWFWGSLVLVTEVRQRLMDRNQVMESKQSELILCHISYRNKCF